MANLRPKVLNANGYDELLDDGDTIQLVAAPTADDHATNRLYVDTTVTTAVDAEEAARIAADGVLQGNIDAEEAARIAADAVLQGNIDAEETARIDADSNLQDQIDLLAGGSLDGRYVERAGDNMTGNLTLGTNKITLDASSGHATFAGVLEAASIDGGSY